MEQAGFFFDCDKVTKFTNINLKYNNTIYNSKIKLNCNITRLFMMQTLQLMDTGLKLYSG